MVPLVTRRGSSESFLESKIMNTFMKIMGPFLLVFLTVLVGGIVYVYFSILLPKAYPEPSFMKFLHFTFACWMVFNITFNYLRIVTVDPGSPKPGEYQYSSSRFCRHCNIHKPPGCHHCSICNKCILKHDHHCPWVLNCVGLRNHKYFVLFLIYMAVGCTYISMMSAGPSWAIMTGKQKPFSVPIVVTAMFTVVFAFALSLFALWQLYMILGDEKRKNFQEFFMTGRYWWTFFLPSLKVVEDDSKLGVLRSV